MRGRDLGGDRASASRSALTVLRSLEQRVEHQAGVADQADFGLDVLVEMVGIERRVDDGLALGHGDAEGGLGERAADAEDHVGLAEEFRHRARHATPPEPSDSGCVSRKCALPPRLVRDRGGEQFGELPAAAARPSPNARPGRHRSPAALRRPAARRLPSHARDRRRSACAAPACSSAVPAPPRSTCRPGLRR